MIDPLLLLKINTGDFCKEKMPVVKIEQGIYEEIEIEDMEFEEDLQTYFYPCPCGDRFQIMLEDLHDGEDIASCPSCSLRIRVIFEPEDLPDLAEELSDQEEKESETLKEVTPSQSSAPSSLPSSNGDHVTASSITEQMTSLDVR
mmetsp:Transcript_5054/g.7685  ORF Transcript_5054/g.7685 Transcript_5054/m.7685 type:complete len:145 (-) Transcript_5054:319-753(-)